MDKLEVNGKVWGRVMMGKQGKTPMYRVEDEGKFVPVKAALVPQEVKDAFEGVIVPQDEPTQDVVTQEDVEDDFGFDGKVPEVDWKQMYEEATQNDAEHLSLKELCNILYSRFGVYTCYIQKEPGDTDVHPITGGLMTNFLRGQARQQYLSAVANRTNYDPKIMQSILKSRENARFDFNAHREAHKDRFVKPDIEKPTDDNPYSDKKLTMKEWRDMRNAEKPLMSSEHGRRGDGTDEDELYAEPPINGRTIVRPYATNPIAERRLAEKKALRERGY